MGRIAQSPRDFIPIMNLFCASSRRGPCGNQTRIAFRVIASPVSRARSSRWGKQPRVALRFTRGFVAAPAMRARASIEMRHVLLLHTAFLVILRIARAEARGSLAFRPIVSTSPSNAVTCPRPGPVAMVIWAAAVADAMDGLPARCQNVLFGKRSRASGIGPGGRIRLFWRRHQELTMMKN